MVRGSKHWSSGALKCILCICYEMEMNIFFFFLILGRFGSFYFFMNLKKKDEKRFNLVKRTPIYTMHFNNSNGK